MNYIIQSYFQLCRNLVPVLKQTERIAKTRKLFILLNW